ncbi:MAG: hypothetical protein J0H88_16230 [Sphingomonadales bacterium]|nr:hypothetical protein [Sphingomonadales bacterium]
MTEIAFIDVKPRRLDTGAEVTVRLAGGGSVTPYHRDGQHYRAGIVDMPRFRAAFGFDDNGWTGGTVPTSGELTFAPSERSLLTALLAHYWRDAAIIVDAGDERDALARRLTGTVADMTAVDGQLMMTIADPGKLLDKPLLGAGFAGTGGIEGPSEATGREKRRSLGRVFNVELRLLDKANNIYEAGDPSKGLQAFDAVRDMGRAGSMAVLAWQGSVAATFAALQASSPAQGGCVAAPSIACVKWWTVPAGPLTADIRGENAGGYVETAVAIAAKLLAAVGGPAIADFAAANALRTAPVGVHIASSSDTVAQAIDRLLLGVSLYWVLQPDATIRIGEWAWTAPVASMQAIFIGRERQLPPVKSRKVGYRRNHRQHQQSEISAAVLLANDVAYLDGTPIEALKPGQAGADVTGTNTAAAIAGQGALATQNAADWKTRVTGVGKPSNNAGTSRILSAIGNHVTLIGNSIRKDSGTHSAWQGGVVGAPQKNTAFVSSSTTYDASGAGGWAVALALDISSATQFDPHAMADGSFFAVLVAQSPNCALTVYKRSGGSSVSILSATVPGLNTAARRMAFIYNGRRVFVMIDGVVYGGNSSAYDVTPGTTFFPKVLSYHRDDFNTGAGSVDGILDIQYGDWTDVRTYLDDGYSILNQAGFKTDEGTSAAIAGQGPGATAPGADVLNYVDSTGGGNSMSVIRQPAGGQYAYDGGAVAGCIKIAAPVNYTNTMIRFAVDVYDYQVGAQVTYIISGYAYAGGGATNGTWENVSAQYVGPEGFARRVRFGYDGSRVCVWIGETATNWSYPKVLVRDLIVGYANVSAAVWKSGWTVSVSGTAPANAPSGVIREVTKPRPGDAVFGEGIIEVGGGAIATLPNFKTPLGTAAAIVGQGAGATANNLSDLDAAAAASLAALAGGARTTVGYGQIIKKRLGVGGSASFEGSISVLGGGSYGTMRARIEVSLAGAGSYSAVATGSGAAVGPGEPGQDYVSGTFTNSTGIEQVFDFRIIDVRTPGGAGAGVVAAQTFLEG